MTENRATTFEATRPRLRAIAARVLGSDSDADDAVQEAWLRFDRTSADDIENPEAWLTTVVSRISLDILRSPRRAREAAWRVEPWLDVAADDDPAADVELADAAGVALLIVLERLSPAERLAFVLHDVFGQSFEEIAVTLNRSPEAARQLASRARRGVQRGEQPARPSRSREREIVEAWLAAAREGDLSRLTALLDEGAVLNADYGTSTQHLDGAKDIVAQAVLAARLAMGSTLVRIGGRPGVLARINGRAVSLMAFDIENERIVALEVLADPKRLSEFIQ